MITEEKQATKAERKVKALEIMKELDIYKPYIDGFKKHDRVCFYENYAGFWAYQDNDLEAKIQEIEKRYDCTVYAVTHEFTEFGELYDFLLVTAYPEEWSTLYEKEEYQTAFAYVWNRTDDWCSEFGQISVDSFGGGIKRIA